MFNKTKHISYAQPLRNIYNTPFLLEDYYKKLGIKKGATQAEIKTAYYRQSMIYHPDKNINEETTEKKFKEITEAYEVLGNVQSRKLYDKGMTMRPTVRLAEDDDDDMKFYKSRKNRHKVPVHTGRTPIYDFDTWTQAHYSKTRERVWRHKQFNAYRQQMELNYDGDTKARGFMICISTLIFATIVLLSYINDFDKVPAYLIEKNKPKAKKV